MRLFEDTGARTSQANILKEIHMQILVIWEIMIFVLIKN
jgi:hypothetical protein